jgi:hypothetical protein
MEPNGSRSRKIDPTFLITLRVTLDRNFNTQEIFGHAADANAPKGDHRRQAQRGLKPPRRR